MTGDPFAELGLAADASADEVRSARRRLAKELHPDAGGDAPAMQRVNAAAAQALRQIRDASSADPHPHAPAEPTADPDPSRSGPQWAGVGFDVPSFTVEALPVETFHALLLACESLGEVADEDPPYRLDVEMYGPPRAWCRLEIFPDAGASTVSLAAAAERGVPLRIESVRDRWVDALNALDWAEVAGN